MFKIKFYKYLLMIFLALTVFNFAFADTTTPNGKAMPWIPLLLLDGGGLKGMDLIEYDYQKQAINYESYLVYKTQYIFGDPALPEKYQDQTLTPDATLFLNDIAMVFYTLSEDCRQTLTPYLLRPDNPNSYIYQTIVSRYTTQMTKSSVQLTDIQPPSPFDFEPFKYIDTSDGYLRIWYHYIPDDLQNNKWKQQAQELATDLDGKAYDRFYKLLGKHPPYDLDLGGNERLDLYLMDPQVMEILAWRSTNPGDYAGINLSEVDNLFNTGSFSIIKTKLTRTEPDFTREQLRGIAVHEMFHMFQRSFEDHGNEWWTEATADFAMQLVYPDDDIERWIIHSFIDYPAITLTSMEKKHQYGAYLFPFFLAKSFGEPFFASIFKDDDGNSPIIDTIENKLGSLDDAWKEFVLWNTMPNEYYGEIKKFAVNQTFAGHPNNRIVIFAPGRITADIPALEPLSAYLIDVLLENDDFKHVSFNYLTDFNIQGTNTAIQALIYQTDGSEIPNGWEDWSNRPRQDYFITRSNDRIYRVLIILSNAHPKKKTTPSHLYIDTNTVGDYSFHHSETRTYRVEYPPIFQPNISWIDYNPTFTIEGNFVGPGVIPEALQASPCLGLYTASWSVTGLPYSILLYYDGTVTKSGTISFDLSSAWDKIRYGFSDTFFTDEESGDLFYPGAGSLEGWDENGATISLPYNAIIQSIIRCPGCNNEVIDESPVYIKIVK